MFIRRFSKTIKAVDACGKPRRGFPSPVDACVHRGDSVNAPGGREASSHALQ